MKAIDNILKKEVEESHTPSFNTCFSIRTILFTNFSWASLM